MPARKKSLEILYNGVQVWEQLEPYIEKFTYTDSVDASDEISFSVIDRELKWIHTWIPEKGDIIQPSIVLENWNDEGEKKTFMCGSFVVDDFGFSAPPRKGEINGVSSPVNTGFKETENTKTWEAATIRLIGAEIAAKYGLILVYDSDSDIQIAKTEQSQETDSTFLKRTCEKYGLGMKVYANRLVIWDYQKYFAAEPIRELTPSKVSKWSYRSTMQGTYTGARVSYTDPSTKKTLDVLIGEEGRVYKSNQKADNEADARLIGEAAVRNANRKAQTMQITLPPDFAILATRTIQLSDFGKMDGLYFVEKVSHSIGRKSYTMQVHLSRITEEKAVEAAEGTENSGSMYVVQTGDTLWDISKKFYGNPGRYPEIYAANASEIEADAKRHGKANSNEGYWIWPGLQLTIP